MAQTQLPASLVADVSGGYELVVGWAPGKTMPVTISFIKVNDLYVAKRDYDTDSPFVVAKLPPPSGNVYVLHWGITPEVDLSVIAVVIRRRDGLGEVVADKKNNAKRGAPWFKKGVNVNAP